MVSLGNDIQETSAAPARQSSPTAMHFFGVGSLIVAGIGVPMMLTVASKDRLDTADQWVLRGAALATAAIVAPIGYMYLSGVRRNGG